MDLLLLRHGEAARNATDADRADPHLSDVGRRQAERVAAVLVEEPPEVLCASPLRRARETAEIIGERVGLRLLIDPDLAEFDRDAPAYLHFEDLRAANDPLYDAVLGGDLTSFGVDLGEFRSRVVSCIERLVDRFAGRRLVIVTHGGPINAYLGSLLGTERLFIFSSAYTGISRVRIEPGRAPLICTVGEAAHLRGLDDAVPSAAGGGDQSASIRPPSSL
jgi:2,3-bisphosphoglycerate-dependent phosphoglycerate mutase